MHKLLDMVDLKAIEALATYGPRNISDVSKKIQIPAETLRKRIKRIHSKTFLRFHVNVCHSNLGLVTGVVFAEAIPGYEDVLVDALKINDFWIFLCRVYGMFEGCFGIFSIPKERCGQFEHFVNEIRRLGLARRIQVFWASFFHPTPSLCKWFDEKTKSWKFDWEKWVSEIKSPNTKSLHFLEMPEFSVKADETDVLLIKELEKDATISLKKLAKKLGMSSQLVGYHYHKHVLGRGLLESFRVTVFHFGENSEFSYFIFKFRNSEKLANFTSTLLDKPFVKTLGKIIDENKLYACLYFPRSEFRIFLGTLSRLVRDGFLESYQYVIQDLNNSAREIIPFQCFKEGRWMYNHEGYVHILHKYLTEKQLIDKLAIQKAYTTVNQKIHKTRVLFADSTED